MKISHKLILVVLLGLSTIVSLGAIANTGIKQIHNSFHDLVEYPIPSILRLSEMTEVFVVAVDSAHAYQMYGFDVSQQKYFLNMKKFQDLLSELKDDLGYGTADFPAEDKELIDGLSAHVDELSGIIETHFKNRVVDEDHKMLLVTVQAKEDEIIALLHSYRELEKSEIIFAHEEIDTVANRLLFLIPFLVFLFFGINLVVNSVLIKSIISPLKQLGDVTRGFGGGDMKKRVHLTRSDELGELASSFDAMAENVERSHKSMEAKIQERTAELEQSKSGLQDEVLKRTRELEQLKSSLEEGVASRTAELKLKMKQLERMNTMMVDRELTMIKLKKENSELRQQAERK